MHQIFGVGTERNSFANGQVGGSNGFNHDLLWSSWVCPTKIRLINDSQRLFAFCIFGGSAVKYDSPGGWICNLFRRPQETYSISSSMFSLLYARWSFLYHFLCGGTYFWVRLGYVSIWKSHENGKKFKDKRETNWTRFGWISSFFWGWIRKEVFPDFFLLPDLLMQIWRSCSHRSITNGFKSHQQRGKMRWVTRIYFLRTRREEALQALLVCCFCGFKSHYK